MSLRTGLFGRGLHRRFGGGLVLISADDPGMASSQNEQDNRQYARAAGVIMLEPADSQQAYDFTGAAFAISEQFEQPVMLRMTTRATPRASSCKTPAVPGADAGCSNIPSRVMIPALRTSGAPSPARQAGARAAAYAEDCPQTLR